MLTRLALVAACATSSASAQSSIAQFLPADPMVVLELDGPKKLAERFKGTNVAAMASSQEMGAWWSRLVEAIQDRADDDPDGREILAALTDTFDDYAGHMSSGLRIRPGESGEPEFLLTFAFSPDEDSDLAGLAEKITEKIYAKDGVKLEERTLGDGTTVEVLLIEDGLETLVPKLIDDHLVFAFGKLDGYLAQLRGDEEREVHADSSAAFRFEARRELWAQLPEWLESSDDFQLQMAGNVLAPLLDLLDSMQKFSWTAVPAGKYLEMRGVLEYDPLRPNFADFLKPQRAIDVLGVAARTRTSASGVSFNLGKILDVVGSMLEPIGQSMEELEDRFAEMAGVQLRGDVLDHLDGTLVVLNENSMEDPDQAAMTFVIGLKDTAAFEKNIETVLRSRGLHAARKTKEYRGLNVRELILGAPVVWAISDGSVLLSVGDFAGQSVRGLIDRLDDRKHGVDPRPWPKGVQQRLDAVGGKGDWLSISDASDDVELATEALAERMEGGNVPDEFAALLVDLVTIMGKFDLVTSVSASNFERGRLVQRMIW